MKRLTADFHFKSIDYASPKAKKELIELKKRRDEVIKAAEVDLDMMRKIKFTI